MATDREGLDLLTEDAGDRSMLRAAQRLVKESVEMPVANPRPPDNPPIGRGGRNDTDLHLPPPAGNNNIFNVLGDNPPQAQAGGGDHARINRDPYMVAQLTEEGKLLMTELYGNQRGGEATPERRLPSVVTGSSAPKGCTAISIDELGVILVSLNRDDVALRTLFWSAALKVMNPALWGLLGPNHWEMQCQNVYIHLYEGMGLSPDQRSLAQHMCVNMYGYGAAEAFKEPKVMLRVLVGRFKQGNEGYQLQTFEKSPGSSNSESDDGDPVGRNQCITDTLRSFQAWMRTFLHNEASDFLQRYPVSLIFHFLNAQYAPILLALPLSSSVNLPGLQGPASLCGVHAVSAAILRVSNHTAELLKSQQTMRNIQEEFTAKKAEDRIRQTLLRDLNKIKDVTQSSPLGKRGRVKDEVKIEKEIGGEKKKKLNRNSRKKGKEKGERDAAGGAPGPAYIKKEPKVTDGSNTKPITDRGPCIYHLATKLKLKDSSGTIYKCPFGIPNCKYRHLPLKDTMKDKAEFASKHCSDTILKAQLMSAIAAASNAFKV